MSTNTNDKNEQNRDPIKGTPGSHPVGTGVGVAGKGVAEKMNPTPEEEYWRKNHSAQPYGTEGPYETYRDAYRLGYEGFGRYGVGGEDFDAYEPQLRQDYERSNQNSELGWERAKLAARSAWQRVHKSREQLVGYDVEDANGNSFGKVHSVWIDERGEPFFLGVKTGWILGRNHVVPVTAAQVNNSRQVVRLPFAADQVKDAPSFDPDDEIDQKHIQEIYRHYDLSYPSARETATRPTPRQQENMEEPRTVELHREHLTVGKREVDAGGIRLRKIVRTETVNQPVELKREEIVVERVPAEQRTATGQANFKEEDIFIPLRREEPVVAKDTEVTEKIRVGKKTEIDRRDIDSDVRSEDVKIERTASRKP